MRFCVMFHSSSEPIEFSFLGVRSIGKLLLCVKHEIPGLYCNEGPFMNFIGWQYVEVTSEQLGFERPISPKGANEQDRSPSITDSRCNTYY